MSLDAVLFDDPSHPVIALDPQAAPMRLGEAPIYRFPEAIESTDGPDGGTTTFRGEARFMTRGPTELGRAANEVRTWTTTVTITSTSASTVSGSFILASTYLCADNGALVDDQCPLTAPFASDAADCELEFPFAGYLREQFPWAQPSNPAEGVGWVLIRPADQSVSNPFCYVGARLPDERFEVRGLRKLHPFRQMTVQQVLAMDGLDFKLGHSPRVLVQGPIERNGVQYRYFHEVSGRGPAERGRTAIELRTAHLIVEFAPMNERASGRVIVLSGYECKNSGITPMQQCPAGTPGDPVAEDAASCSQSYPFTAFRLP